MVSAETFDSANVSYKIAAAVGLLSRNIKVIGTEYDNQFADLYGFHILVSDFYTQDQIDGVNVFNYFKGFARISNVEFIHGGQFSQ